MAISAKDVKELRSRTSAPMMECKGALEQAGGDMDAAIKFLRERGIAKAAKRADRQTTEGVIKARVGTSGDGVTAVIISCETDFSARSDAFQSLADCALVAAEALGADAADVEKLLLAKAGERTVGDHLDEVKNPIRENMQIARAIRMEGIAGTYVHFDGKSAALVTAELGDTTKRGAALDTLLRDICMHIVASVPAPLAVDESGIDADLLESEKEILIKQAELSGKSREIAEKMVQGRMKKFVAERALLAQPFVKDPTKTVADVLKAAEKDLGTSIRVTGFELLKIGE